MVDSRDITITTESGDIVTEKKHIGIEDGAPDLDDPESGTAVMAGEDGSPDDPDAAVIAGEVYAWTGAPFGMYKYRGRLEMTKN